MTASTGHAALLFGSSWGEAENRGGGMCVGMKVELPSISWLIWASVLLFKWDQPGSQHL